MPELPEVEVVRRGLQTVASEITILHADIRGERVARHEPGGPQSLADALTGAKLGSWSRRGKFLWNPLQPSDPEASPQMALVVHLGMSGQLLSIPTAECSKRDERHTRALLSLSNGSYLRFVDQRTFGYVRLGEIISDPHHPQPSEALVLPPPRQIPACVRIAPDALEKICHPETVFATFRRTRRAIKAVLLDQYVLSGLGNIYVDETLHKVGIHPSTPANKLSYPQTETLLQAAATILETAIGWGGTTFDSLYVHVDGSRGYFAQQLAVYGRENRPCLTCETPITRIQCAGRSTHLCTHCQTAEN